MKSDRLPPFSPFLFAGLLLAVVGIGALFILFNFTVPTLGPRWLFFFFGTLGISGVALPIVYFFHWRFPGSGIVTPGILIRQAIWAGVFFDLLAWFQLGRVLSFPLAAAIAAGLGFIEFALRLSERSRFSPDASHRE